MKQETPFGLRFLDAALADAARRDLLRVRPTAVNVEARSFCSNDYLDLARRSPPPVPSGAGASRLVSGERPEHQDLERTIADYVGLPSALVFTSGYAANLGLMASLAGPDDLIVSDAFNHASLIDGMRLSRAHVVVVPHLDAGAVERALAGPRPGRAFVVTESYFSMDADGPDLARLRALCDAHGAALVVDEAHALGVLGPEGRGLCAAASVVPDALTGTFGKAFGAGGAFVAGCPALITWLWNRARSFVFSTGLSPAVAAAAHAGVTASQDEPGRRERVAANVASFRAGLVGLGIQPLGFGHIVPWVIGEPTSAMRVAAVLRAQGIDIRAIRPPSVPEGTSRLRFTMTAALDRRDIDRVVAAIAQGLADGS